MLQACLQSVDLKVDRHFGEGQASFQRANRKEPNDFLFAVRHVEVPCIPTSASQRESLCLDDLNGLVELEG